MDIIPKRIWNWISSISTDYKEQLKKFLETVTCKISMNALEMGAEMC